VEALGRGAPLAHAFSPPGTKHPAGGYSLAGVGMYRMHDSPSTGTQVRYTILTTGTVFVLELKLVMRPLRMLDSAGSGVLATV
jgi:hypothetical protein